ncbi:MAG: acyltransferase [Oscillospiraceae bacterium]
MKGNRVSEYTIFRIIGIMLVVVGHAVAGGITPVSGESGFAASAVNELVKFSQVYIYSFHMPLFFFLSGAVFNLAKTGERPFESVFKSKFLHLMVPYFCFLILYSLPIKMLTGVFNLPSSAYIVSNMFATTESSGHLWFLYKLFSATMLFWIYNKLLLSKRPALWFTTLLAVTIIGINIPMIMFIAPGSIYVVFIAIGFMFEKIRPRVAKWAQSHRLLTIGLFAVYFYFFYVKNLAVAGGFEFNNVYFNRMYDSVVKIALPCVSIFAWFMLACVIASVKKLAESRIITNLDSNCMNIYILHDMLNYIVIWLCGYFAAGAALSADAMLLVLMIRIFGVFAVAWLMSLLLSKAMKFKLFKRTAVIAAAVLFICSVGYVYIGNLVP